MIFAIDFDGTVVEQGGPIRLKHGAAEALCAMKNAGHVLLLHSCRANRALRQDPALNPLWAADQNFDNDAWLECVPLHQDRYLEMVDFIDKELPGVFDAIDDGRQGKPIADVYIDNRSLCIDGSWEDLAYVYGELNEEG